MTRVGFVIHPESSQTGPLLADLVKWADEAGHQAIVTAEAAIALENVRTVPRSELGASIDIAVVLGGDGTMLGAASLVADHDVPVVGVNLGRLGFLTHFAAVDAREALADAIAGKLRTTERMRLSVTYRPGDGDPVTRTALNDAVIHQGAMARLIELEAHLDEQTIALYRADGIIVATPTGSTAYNLAAGGPILVPGQAAMAITPICAHALTNRPLVVPHDATIRLQLAGESRGVVLTVDGQWAHSVLPGDVVEIRKADKPLVLFDSATGYFDILRDKLHWGVRNEAK